MAYDEELGMEKIRVFIVIYGCLDLEVSNLAHHLLWRRLIQFLLMSPSGGWNEEFLRANFMEGDVDAILSIPSPEHQHQDKWVWHYTANGQYSVSSGYHLAVSIQQK